MIYFGLYILFGFIMSTIVNPILVTKTKMWHKLYFYTNMSYGSDVTIEIANDDSSFTAPYRFSLQNFLSDPLATKYLKKYISDYVVLMMVLSPVYTSVFVIAKIIKLAISPLYMLRYILSNVVKVTYQVIQPREVFEKEIDQAKSSYRKIEYKSEKT